VAAAFASKEFLRWKRDGRRAHVFNPSSIALALFSVAVIATGTTWHTRAPEIATTLLRAPGMYTFIFVASLAGQYLFGVTTMTMSAVVSLYLFGIAYFAVTGTYSFGNGYIPIAVFLGMHLLFTDPSTAPRTELGRVAFGILYAAGVFAFRSGLAAVHAPAIYDKLLPVPILNLAVQGIDRAARSRFLARFDPASLGASLTPRRRHLAYIAVWTVAFVAMSAAHAWDRPPGHL
jgi:Na+-translocating ferredoxin:NAD+ oxidoreductase RnfD subunit